MFRHENLVLFGLEFSNAVGIKNHSTFTSTNNHTTRSSSASSLPIHVKMTRNFPGWLDG